MARPVPAILGRLLSTCATHDRVLLKLQPHAALHKLWVGEVDLVTIKQLSTGLNTLSVAALKWAPELLPLAKRAAEAAYDLRLRFEEDPVMCFLSPEERVLFGQALITSDDLQDALNDHELNWLQAELVRRQAALAAAKVKYDPSLFEENKCDSVDQRLQAPAGEPGPNQPGQAALPPVREPKVRRHPRPERRVGGRS